MHRFFAPTMDPGDERVRLPRTEAEHLTRVLRLGIGDTIAVFDGRGHEFMAKVTSAARNDVQVQIVSRLEPALEPRVALTLAAAVLKADKMDEVVRDAVMLGVAALQPIVTRRTETTVATLIKSARVERWRRVALASVKQSRRATLPEVRMPLSLESYLDDPPPAIRLMLVEPDIDQRDQRDQPDRDQRDQRDRPGQPDQREPGGQRSQLGQRAIASRSLATLQEEPPPPDVALLVGPEGGWTEEECQAASAAGIRLVTLGHRTLRADAVPIAAISVLQFMWGDL